MSRWVHLPFTRPSCVLVLLSGALFIVQKWPCLFVTKRSCQLSLWAVQGAVGVPGVSVLSSWRQAVGQRAPVLERDASINRFPAVLAARPCCRCLCFLACCCCCCSYEVPLSRADFTSSFASQSRLPLIRSTSVARRGPWFSTRRVSVLLYNVKCIFGQYIARYHHRCPLWASHAFVPGWLLQQSLEAEAPNGVSTESAATSIDGTP